MRGDDGTDRGDSSGGGTLENRKSDKMCLCLWDEGKEGHGDGIWAFYFSCKG